MYDNIVVHGPYLRKDGRMHVVIINKETRHKTTISYPKYIMQFYLGRVLHEDETVDHIDRDYTNNSINNLQILKRSEHIGLDCKRVLDIEKVCPVCNKTFVLSGEKQNQARQNRLKGKAGPFCGKSCAGKYGASVQNGGSKLPVLELEDSTYYRLGKI